MAHDALDAGPDGTFPWFPRLPDGTPAWSDLCPPDYQGARMPRGMTTIVRDGQRFIVDQSPRDAEGKPLVIP
jgi:hypothetical protein